MPIVGKRNIHRRKQHCASRLCLLPSPRANISCLESHSRLGQLARKQLRMALELGQVLRYTGAQALSAFSSLPPIGTPLQYRGANTSGHSLQHSTNGTSSTCRAALQGICPWKGDRGCLALPPFLELAEAAAVVSGGISSREIKGRLKQWGDGKGSNTITRIVLLQG